MTTLTEILANGSPLPADFLAMRRAAMVAALNGEPIPVLPAYPGVYRPVPTDQLDPELARMERSRNAADAARTIRMREVCQTKRLAA